MEIYFGNTCITVLFFLQSKALFTELILPLEQKLENEFKRSSVGIFHESRRSLFFIVQTFSALIECLFKHRLCNIDKIIYVHVYIWMGGWVRTWHAKLKVRQTGLSRYLVVSKHSQNTNCRSRKDLSVPYQYALWFTPYTFLTGCGGELLGIVELGGRDMGH